MASRVLLNELPAHGELQGHAAALRGASISDLFAADRQRAEDFTLTAAGLRLDYSRQLLHRDARAGLLRLAGQAGVEDGIRALFGGEHLNNTEDRPALHTLLRAASGDGQQERFREVAGARARMRDWAGRL